MAQPTGLLPAGNAWFQNPGMGYYPGNPVAGFNDMQRGGWGSLLSGGQMGQDFAQGIGSEYMNMLQNPYMVDPNNIPQSQAQMIGQGPQLSAMMIGQGPQVQGQNVQGQQIGQGPQVQGQQIGMGPQVSSQNVDTSGMMLGAGERARAQQVGNIPQVGAAGMDMFNNPYLKQSIQAGIDQNNENFNENVLTSLDADAIGAGMSGSSRAGIAQGLAANKLNKANLDMASMLNRDAYNTGMGNWLNQRGQDLSSQTTNAANNLQMQGMNQGANLQATGMNMNDALARAQANQGVGMQGQLANQAANLQGQMANQGAWGQNQRANQQNNMQGQLANQSLWGQTALANQQNNMQGQLANQQTNMQGQLANQSLWGDTAARNQAADLTAQQGNQNQWGQNARANQQYDMMGQMANAQNWLGAQQGNQNYMGGMMNSMAPMMGAYGNAMLAPGAIMSQIGNQQQNQAQKGINAAMQQWNWQQQQPLNQLNSWANLLGSMQGNTMPGYQPPAGPDWGSAMGGLLGGLNEVDWDAIGTSQGGGGYVAPGWGGTGPGPGYNPFG